MGIRPTLLRSQWDLAYLAVALRLAVGSGRTPRDSCFRHSKPVGNPDLRTPLFRHREYWVDSSYRSTIEVLPCTADSGSTCIRQLSPYSATTRPGANRPPLHGTLLRPDDAAGGAVLVPTYGRPAPRPTFGHRRGDRPGHAQRPLYSSAADSAHPRYPVGATHTTTGDQGGQQFLTGSGRNNDRYSSPFSTLLGRAVLISLTLLVPSLHRRLRRVHGAAPGPNCAIAT